MISKENPFGSQAKMLCHPTRMKEYLETGSTTTPILIEVNLTNTCNLKCKYCFSKDDHQNEFIDTKVLINFLQQYKLAGGKAVTWSGGGEPTCHPDFLKIILATKEIGLDQGLMTNGKFAFKLSEHISDCFEWVRVSLDAGTSESYKEIKGVDGFEIVCANIGMIDKNKCKVGINLNLLQDEGYEEEIKEMINILRETGAHYFQIRPVLPRNYDEMENVDRDKLLEQIKYLETLKPEVFNLHKGTKGKVTVSWDKYYDLFNYDYPQYKHCKGHNFECIVDANGDMNVCMYMLKNPDFNMGNIYKDSFIDIWNSQKRKDAMKHCENMDFSKCLVCCKCHEINKLLDFLEDKSLDKNFI